ncbi:hypothetical protein [Streptomyces sp. BA2]|uniref:hypothetical protein n=1 Tax=Streptomyces sp. BA2 TaxID=436595 RepID=UPI0013277585|nr:hypothetical protein [Streptomyces sp. BA2]MWA08250.1 hypothetical protein [Streptomyces sp. BA2]
MPPPQRPRQRLDALHAGISTTARLAAHAPKQAVFMYALVALVPFILLATLMSLSWWEDRILPTPADPTDASRTAPTTPGGPTRHS